MVLGLGLRVLDSGKAATVTYCKCREPLKLLLALNLKAPPLGPAKYRRRI